MHDGTNYPGEPELTLGQRIKRLRLRQGMTQEVLAGLVGKSVSWLKQVEGDRLQTSPRLPILLQLAEALRVRDLAELTGDRQMPVRMFTGPGHPALAAVREAINDFPLAAASGTVQPLTGLRARLDAAWRTRHASPDHRTALGALLPGLIRDAQLAAVMYGGDERRRAQAILAEVYGLAQMYLAYQPAPDLLWRVADRALMAAQEADDPKALACAVWFLTEAHRDAGDLDAALDVTRQGLQAIAPHIGEAGPDLLAMWGALVFAQAFTWARLGRAGEAWHNMDEAARVAERLPEAYYQPWTSFSRVIIPAHAVTVAVELHQGGEAARRAQDALSLDIPSRPRKGRHLIEVARAHHLLRDHQAVLGTLRLAERAAPETIRYNGYARRMVLQLAELPATRAQGVKLGERIGLLA